MKEHFQNSNRFPKRKKRKEANQIKTFWTPGKPFGPE
jgi:hypothetical protein